MATEIVMPESGESVASGVLTTWLKKSGDFVQRDEPIAEVDTDKITVEISSPAAGVLTQSVTEGDEVKIGAVLGIVDDSAKATTSGVASKTTSATGNGRSEPAGLTTATAPSATATATQAGASQAPVGLSAAPAGDSSSDVRATPVARKLAAEHNVDLAGIKGTGINDRIRENDVLAFVQQRDKGGASATPTPVRPSSSLTPRGVTRERMTPLRQKIASRLVEAQHTAAMLTTFNECDMTAVMDLRKSHKESFEKKHGIGLGFMSFFVKAAVNALRTYPMVNSYIVADDEGRPAIEKHDYCDIAVAVSSPKGLVVPVIRNAEQLTFAGVEVAVKDLGTRARDGKLGIEEMQGGTFTITNGGIFGSLMSTPILNPPQSAILGMHAIKNRAIEHPAGSGHATIRPMMYLALSYDHRIIDGSEAVRFLVSIKEAIEDPAKLLLDL